MAGNKTFTIIKPDAFRAGNSGSIIKIIEKAGFGIQNMRLLEMDMEMASNFYSIHKERPFFQDLVSFMVSGPVIVQVLQGENAIALYRKVMGTTNPEEAAEGTIRKKFALSLEKNSVHGSDSPENAEIEINHFFDEADIIS